MFVRAVWRVKRLVDIKQTLREATEEAGVPDAVIRPRLLSVLDLGYWTYTTLVGDVTRRFEPTIKR